MPLIQPPAPRSEAELVAEVDVDERAHRATEDDEGQALAELYGPADEDGIYRGTGA